MTVDFNIIKKALNYAAKNSGFYRKLFQGIDIGKIDNLKDFESLPFSDKHDLRAAYPLGIQAFPMIRSFESMPPPAPPENR